jgi:hypothetical protein
VVVEDELVEATVAVELDVDVDDELLDELGSARPFAQSAHGPWERRTLPREVAALQSICVAATMPPCPPTTPSST